MRCLVVYRNVYLLMSSIIESILAYQDQSQLLLPFESCIMFPQMHSPLLMLRILVANYVHILPTLPPHALTSITKFLD